MRTRLALLAVALVAACMLVEPAAAAASVAKIPAPANPHHHDEPTPNVEKLRVKLDDALQLSVTPTLLDSPTATVTISWSNNVHAEASDWIAAYSPPPTSAAGFLSTLPIKYRNLTSQPGESGSTTLWLLHMRAPYVLVYMKGGFDTPTVVAVSEVVHYTPEVANTPMQIHLARTADPTQMRISWVTTNASHPVVQWGPVGKAPAGMISTSASTSTYTRDMMCGGLAAALGWRDPGSLHTAVLEGLEAGVEYAYQVGDASVGGVYSDVTTFWSAPAASSDVDFIIMGDQGQAELDGSIEWAEWVHNHGALAFEVDQPAAVNTSIAIHTELAEGRTIDNRTALVLLIGDISYARGRGAMWDQYMYLNQPFLSRVAQMTCLGNHEMDFLQAALWNGTDSGGECGVPTQFRFPMPSPKLPAAVAAAAVAGPKGAHAAPSAPSQGFSDTPFYSFDHGAVHFVLLSSEHAFDRASAQWAWLEADLASVDRSVTPWLLVSAHRPMYVSSTNTGTPSSDMGVAALLRQEVEPLLLKYKVDAFFAGHHHSQQITCAVANQTCVDAASRARAQAYHLHDDASLSDVVQPQVQSGASEAPTHGIVHFVVGAAGQWCNTYLSPSHLDWLLYANTADHGFTRVKVRGHTMTLDFVSSDDRRIITSTTIVQQKNKPHIIHRHTPSHGSKLSEA